MPSKQITPEQLARARHSYEQTSVPVRVIADGLGVSEATVLRWARKWGWALRSERVPKVPPPAGPAVPRQPAEPAPVDAGAAPSAVPLSRIAVTLRVQEAVERELAAIDAIVAGLKGEPRQSGDAERTARTLASLTRTLREVMRLDAAKSKPEPADNAVPRSVDELRRTLTEKLDRLVAGDQGAVARDS